jgi:hypothetical protein
MMIECIHGYAQGALPLGHRDTGPRESSKFRNCMFEETGFVRLRTESVSTFGDKRAMDTARRTNNTPRRGVELSVPPALNAG